MAVNHRKWVEEQEAHYKSILDKIQYLATFEKYDAKAAVVSKGILMVRSKMPKAEFLSKLDHVHGQLKLLERDPINLFMMSQYATRQYSLDKMRDDVTNLKVLRKAILQSEREEPEHIPHIIRREFYLTDLVMSGLMLRDWRRILGCEDDGTIQGIAIQEDGQLGPNPNANPAPAVPLPRPPAPPPPQPTATEGRRLSLTAPSVMDGDDDDGTGAAFVELDEDTMTPSRYAGQAPVNPAVPSNPLGGPSPHAPSAPSTSSPSPSSSPAQGPTPPHAAGTPRRDFPVLRPSTPTLPDDPTAAAAAPTAVPPRRPPVSPPSNPEPRPPVDTGSQFGSRLSGKSAGSSPDVRRSSHGNSATSSQMSSIASIVEVPEEAPAAPPAGPHIPPLQIGANAPSAFSEPGSSQVSPRSEQSEATSHAPLEHTVDYLSPKRHPKPAGKDGDEVPYTPNHFLYHVTTRPTFPAAPQHGRTRSWGTEGSEGQHSPSKSTSMSGAGFATAMHGGPKPGPRVRPNSGRAVYDVHGPPSVPSPRSPATGAAAPFRSPAAGANGFRYFHARTGSDEHRQVLLPAHRRTTSTGLPGAEPAAWDSPSSLPIEKTLSKLRPVKDISPPPAPVPAPVPVSVGRSGGPLSQRDRYRSVEDRRLSEDVPAAAVGPKLGRLRPAAGESPRRPPEWTGRVKG